MFWKNTAWSWADASGHDDDDDGYQLTADLRNTPDSSPCSDPSHTTTTTTTVTSNLPNCTKSTTGLKDLTSYTWTCSRFHSFDSAYSKYSSAPTNSGSYVSTLCTNISQHLTTRDSSSTRQRAINIVRGTDGFGFTICYDCPVRVQAVDAGGPAHQSGLLQGDCVLQLNGLPVETWKCAELAHAIRSCPTKIALVVWRGLPELMTGCDALLHQPTHNTTTGRKFLPHPAHSKHGCRGAQGSVGRSSLATLGSFWRDRKEYQEEEEEAGDMTTMKAPVTSANGDNYIILSAVTSGGQHLHPVYHDRNGTIATPSNYGNYQNCTILKSHLPCTAYESYVTLAPKTLIFPIFVQPLDLCSQNRTLLMSEEMILHQADLLPAKVTVLIYNDLLLLTREDEAGHCSVLQSPLYLNTLELRDVPSEPLHIYFMQTSQTFQRCIFSLESFSVEQKIRVHLCLHDNMPHQVVAKETRHNHQLSDLHSDFGLLSLDQSDLLYHPTSPYSSSDPPQLQPFSHPSSLCATLRPLSCPPCSSSTPPAAPFSAPLYASSPASRPIIAVPLFPEPPPTSSSAPQGVEPVWKERGNVEEEERRKRRTQEEMDEAVEERQQGEGESASETSENVGVVGGPCLLFSPNIFHMNKEEESDKDDDEEEAGGDKEFTIRPTVSSVHLPNLSPLTSITSSGPSTSTPHPLQTFSPPHASVQWQADVRGNTQEQGPWFSSRQERMLE